LTRYASTRHDVRKRMTLGLPELLIILAIVLLLFGSTRLPKLARSLGQASKEFKEGINEGRESKPDEPDTATKD
jgi:sec-independent protein translocase protein TatA